MKAGSEVAAREEKKHFILPVAGADGPADFLRGKTVVLSGIFPEIGGGTGLNMGKDRLKKMIESFGGRVTSAISGKTDYLVIGKAPGMSKVTKARSQPHCQLLTPTDLKKAICGEQQIEDAASVQIESFSAGYFGRGLAPKASIEEFAIASGKIEPPPRVQKASAMKGDESAETKSDMLAIAKTPAKAKKSKSPASGVPKRKKEASAGDEFVSKRSGEDLDEGVSKRTRSSKKKENLT